MSDKKMREIKSKEVTMGLEASMLLYGTKPNIRLEQVSYDDIEVHPAIAETLEELEGLKYTEAALSILMPLIVIPKSKPEDEASDNKESTAGYWLIDGRKRLFALHNHELANLKDKQLLNPTTNLEDKQLLNPTTNLEDKQLTSEANPEDDELTSDTNSEDNDAPEFKYNVLVLDYGEDNYKAEHDALLLSMVLNTPKRYLNTEVHKTLEAVGDNLVADLDVLENALNLKEGDLDKVTEIMTSEFDEPKDLLVSNEKTIDECYKKLKKLMKGTGEAEAKPIPCYKAILQRKTTGLVDASTDQGEKLIYINDSKTVNKEGLNLDLSAVDFDATTMEIQVFTDKVSPDLFEKYAEANLLGVTADLQAELSKLGMNEEDEQVEDDSDEDDDTLENTIEETDETSIESEDNVENEVTIEVENEAINDVENLNDNLPDGIADVLEDDDSLFFDTSIDDNID